MKWQPEIPKVGEWAFFWENKKHEGAVWRKLKRVHLSKGRYFYEDNASGFYWDNCSIIPPPHMVNGFVESPEIVPFTFKDAEFLLGKAVKRKFTNGLFLINGVDDDKRQHSIQIGEGWISFKRLFDNFTFLDGSPCGKEEA